MLNRGPNYRYVTYCNISPDPAMASCDTTTLFTIRHDYCDRCIIGTGWWVKWSEPDLLAIREAEPHSPTIM
eukprot:9511228-Prorocentrum_lima.AAC.1